MKEFKACFQITKAIMFEVEYYKLGNNKNPYFSTSAIVFTRNKRDISQCGQCQNKVLPKGSVARSFFRKWNDKHLEKMSDSEFMEMLEDLEILKNEYNYIYRESEIFGTVEDIQFYECKELSMLDLK